jgi:hypothetical protein
MTDDPIYTEFPEYKIAFSLSNKTPYKIMVTSKLKSTEKLEFELKPFDRETNCFEQKEQTYIEIISTDAEKRIEQLEAALFSIYVAPNDQPFIKSQIESVLDVNECRQKWGKNKDEQTP